MELNPQYRDNDHPIFPPFRKGGMIFIVCLSLWCFGEIYVIINLLVTFLGWIFYFKDIITGLILGLGSFSVVKEVREITRHPQMEDIFDVDHPLLFDEVRCVRQNYAIKQVRTDLSLSTRRDAYVCLEKEAKLLSDLNHPNLIRY